MTRFVKLTVFLVVSFVAVGCSAWVDQAKGWFSGDGEDCEYVTVTVYLPPVVANLDYQAITGMRSQAIVLGGYQHVLSVPGTSGLAAGFPVSTGPSGTSVRATETIRFDYDRVALAAGDREKLDRLLGLIKAQGIRSIAIEGHSDAKGSVGYNRRLSLRRAERVRSYLVGGGIAPAKIAVTGYGESQPESTNTTAHGRAMNRRATIIYPGEQP